MAYVKETRSRTVGRDYHKRRPGGISKGRKGDSPSKEKGTVPLFRCNGPLNILTGVIAVL